MVQHRPQHGVHRVGPTPGVTVVQLVYKPLKLCPVKPARRVVLLDCGDHLGIDIKPLRGMTFARGMTFVSAAFGPRGRASNKYHLLSGLIDRL